MVIAARAANIMIAVAKLAGARTPNAPTYRCHRSDQDRASTADSLRHFAISVRS